MEKVTKLSRSPYAGKVIRVAIPAKVAVDYDKFIEVQRSIFDRLGHLACTSGFDIRWDTVSRFAVDENLQVNEQLG